MKFGSKLRPLVSAAAVALAVSGVHDALSNEHATTSVLDVRGIRLVDRSGVVRGEFALDGDDIPTLVLNASDGTKRVIAFATDTGCWLAGSTTNNSGFALTAMDGGSLLTVMDSGEPRLSAGCVLGAPSLSATSKKGEVIAIWP